MAKEKRERKLLTYTGGIAIAALALNLIITAINNQRKRNKKKGINIHTSFIRIYSMFFYCKFNFYTQEFEIYFALCLGFLIEN